MTPLCLSEYRVPKPPRYQVLSNSGIEQLGTLIPAWCKDQDAPRYNNTN
jgi:hypothetical protein